MPKASDLAALILQNAGPLIATVRDLFVQQHPNQPAPTSEEILRAFETAFTNSLAVDDLILAQHAHDDE